jgi:uncharacterized BrkB/YihY/UPF0761 family membrane protein
MPTFIVLILVVTCLITVPAQVTERAMEELLNDQTKTRRQRHLYANAQIIFGATFGYCCLMVLPLFALGAFYGAGGMLGIDWEKLFKEHPQVHWLLSPFIPFIGLPMFVVALIICCFYKPHIISDIPVLHHTQS